MHVVEIFVPTTFGTGGQIPKALLELLKQELTDEFGGVTAYTRSPAEGLWKSGDNVERDVVLILEVMTGSIDKPWWKAFRQRTEAVLRQQEILIRASRVTRI